MLDSYILLGGSGATLGLIIAIFIASRRADHRQVAKLALPSGIFQINEPILFGLPIIMNPVMFIPFVLVQPILATLVYLPFVVLSNKAQTVIEQEESEEDIANALKF